MSCQGATARFRPWTPAEDAAIRSRYIPEGAPGLAREFGRTAVAVHHRANRIGVIRRRRFTAAEDRRIAMLWGEMSLKELAKTIGRTPAVTYWRAQHMGLPLGCVQGLEYLTDSAKRTGFTISTLRMILKWAGVGLRVSMSRPTKARRHYHVVDPDDVNDAIERWLKTETLAAAAERLGVACATVERRLLASGNELPPKPAGKKRWRVPSDLVDEVMVGWIPWRRAA